MKASNSADKLAAQKADMWAANSAAWTVEKMAGTLGCQLADYSVRWAYCWAEMKAESSAVVMAVCWADSLAAMSAAWWADLTADSMAVEKVASMAERLVETKAVTWVFWTVDSSGALLAERSESN